MESPTIDTVRKLCTEYSNWGRWGADDELGTLNFIMPEHLVRAAACVRSGKRISLGLPFDENGPQTGAIGRFNPIHLMIRSGADVVADTMVRDFYGGTDRYIRGADDVVIMPLQCGTQWDGLSHVMFEGKMYNGYDAGVNGSKGAVRNGIEKMKGQIAGRGVLLDMARFKGYDALPTGFGITSEDLEACADAQGVEVGTGDFLLVRTGMMGERLRNGWGDYAGGDAPGMALDSARFVHEREIASLSLDTWGMDVRPNETPDVYQPLHLVFIVHMGLLVGEIFDLEDLAADCAGDGQYDFLFTAPPLPITGAVGSPINPVVIK